MGSYHYNAKTFLAFKLLDLFKTGLISATDLFSAYKSDYLATSAVVDIKREKKRFDNALYRLKKDGLLQNNVMSGRLWSITSKGKDKLWMMRDRQKKLIPKKKYEIAKDDRLKIVIFDVPEKYKTKRVWLREVLVSLNFSMLQKSVWIGKNKLPREFLGDLNALDLLPYIEIFVVTKFGTLLKNRK